SAEVFDPATQKWSPAGDMSAARASLVAAPLPGGGALAAGGTTGTATLGSTDRWAPDTTLAVPASLGFADQGEGGSGPPTSLTLRNSGTQPLRVANPAIGGTNAGDFAVSSDGCSGAPIAPGATCTLQLRFTPHGPGSRTASLTFADNTPDAHTVTLSGRGL